MHDTLGRLSILLQIEYRTNQLAAVAKVQADACHLRPNDVSGLILALTFASLFFTSSVVILRLISKGSNQSNFKADDFIVTAALVRSLAAPVILILIF